MIESRRIDAMSADDMLAVGTLLSILYLLHLAQKDQILLLDELLPLYRSQKMKCLVSHRLFENTYLAI